MPLPALLGRRWPTYFTGFLIGMAAMITLFYAKQKFAPKFIDKEDKRPLVELATGGSMRLRYSGEPEKRLVHGFPSTLYLAKEGNEGRWKPMLKLDYKQLVNKENLLGPWEEPGNYEIRIVLYVCREPGEPECLRRLVVQPFKIGSGPKKEAEFTVDLDADLPAPSQARPIP